MQEKIIAEINNIISKYEYRDTIRTQRVIEDLKNIIFTVNEEKKPETTLEEVQLIYKQKYLNIPNNKKNDLQRLSSKL